MAEYFRKLASRLRFRKVRSRFFATMILLSLPPLFLLGYVSYDIAKNTLTDNITKTNHNHLQTSSEVADLLIRNIINLNRFIVLDDEIRNDLRESRPKSSEELSEMNALTIRRLQRIINSNSFDTRYLDSMCIFDLHYQTYCLGRSDDAGIYETPDKKRMIEQSPWYQTAYEAQGRVIYTGYNVLGDKPNMFSTVKLFRDSESVEGKPIGLIVMNLSKTMFGNVFSGSEQDGRFLAVDTSLEPASIVYPEELNMLPGLSPGSLQQIVDQLKEQGFLVSEYRNQATEWTFLHLIRKNELFKQSNRIGTVTAVIASVIALFALAVSYVVSGSITQPLLQLKKMMIDWNKGSRELEGSYKEDEVGAIGQTFKRMALENQELDARLYHSELKEREAELRALQAQIKPHFLYNTLDSIYWMARLKKTEEAAAMALALSESFKLSLNKGKETIPVYKELKHIEHYMTIQHIRYNGRFRYVADVDPAIVEYEIQKLILQPLVENAIYHGLEPKMGAGCICVTGRKDGVFLHFTVEDDGIGMDDIAQTEQGYGIRNVRERLTLYYGPSSSFEVFSEPGKGTRIEIRIKPFADEVVIVDESAAVR